MVTMVMGVCKGRVLEKEKFPICQLLPKAFVRDSDPVYIVPVHHLQHYMGYAIIQLDFDLVSNVNIKSWFIHLDSALENLRMKDRLHQVANELENLYIRDTLTGLYNRRAMEKYGDKIYHQCVESGSLFMIMEIDMDGLKQVNDQYGHEEGDLCIATIANAMIYAAKEEEICVRSGGDEYVVIGQDYDQEKLDKFLKRFNEFLEHANDTFGKPYRFGASVGYYMGVPDGSRKLENYLKIADERMYENKKIRKAKTHPGVGVR
jgi:diguanylate cyclase (GGDEF)-like protein